MLESYLLFASIWFLAAATPGADTMLLLTGSLSRGPKSAIALAVGIIVAKVALLVISYFGITALLTSTPVLVQGLKFVGAAFLIWRAVKAWRKPQIAESQNPSGFLASFGLAFSIAFINPQALLFYLAVVPQVALTTNLLVLSLIVALGFSLISAAYIGLAVPIRSWITREASQIRLSRFIAIVFVGLAIAVLLR